MSATLVLLYVVFCIQQNYNVLHYVVKALL